jgi:hypothetical protein
MALPGGSWPLVLCGPILRRVQDSAVSIFVVLRESRQVTLEVHGAGSGAPQQPLFTGTAATRQLGQRLHVCVVTATASAGTLISGVNYRYDVVLGSDRLGSTAVGLLAGQTPLGYTAGELPSFALPPGPDPTGLELIHASCRKPHGESLDAMPIVDDIIANTRVDPLARPHQMFLTGDQIYADDVAAPLLNDLMAVEPDLLGWPGGEEIPRAGTTVKPRDVRPGDRTAVVRPPLTSSEADSHLMTFGEFAAMYLYAWSDALWPAALPRFGALPQAERQRWARKVRLPRSRDLSEQEYRQIQEEHAERDYNAVVDVLEPFRQTVPKVRRALANVPTFMQFDDHEITDDWFLHKKARDDTLGDAVGKRIVANGLAAYAVFQAWGNIPARFAAATAGETLLNRLQTWRGKQDSTFDDICTAVGLGTGGGIEWDFSIDFPAHRLLVLDTRTHRGYPSSDPRAAPDLLTSAEITRQVSAYAPATPTAAKPVTVVLSPAPVFGHPTHEWVASALGRIGAELFGDREAWLVDGRPKNFEEFIAALVPFERVVLLGGDVHYASSLWVEYWDERTATGRQAAFAQFTSSGAKNEDVKTRNIARITPGERAWLGWPGPGPWLSDDGSTLQVGGTPAIQEVPRGDALLAPPKWRYRATFCKDNRRSATRGTPGTTFGPAGTWLEQARNGAMAQRGSHNDQYRGVVGVNNLGDIQFAASQDSGIWQVGAFHRLWYRLGGPNDALRPYTVHMVSLLKPDPLDQPTPAEVRTALPDLRAWADLLSFRPPLALQRGLRGRGPLGGDWWVHRIEEAWGDVNLDYYPVTVTSLPTIVFDADELLLHIRLFLDPEFVNTAVAEFSPYDASIDGPKWLSSSPTGAVIHIDMKAGGINLDDGSVLTAEADASHWRFSTIWTSGDFGHPVSGNREFGYVTNADGSFTFYTRGADRTTALLDLTAANAVYSGADTLWQSFQTKVAAYVNANRGSATAGPRIWARYRWPTVSARYLSPHERWLPR